MIFLYLSQHVTLKLYTSLLCLMKPSQNGIEHNLQNSVEEGASAPMLQVERNSSPSAAEFAFEGQDALGQDCSLEVCRAQSLQYVYMDDDIIIYY